MKLSEYLTLKGMTATDFAKKAEVEVSTITRILRSERRPTWTTLTKIRKASGDKVRAIDFEAERA